MNKPLNFNIDRSAKTSLSEQIRKAMAVAMESGVLVPGARLPSWQDLSAQLGVARGTVRTAYAKLAAAQLIEASRASGTRVAQRPRPIAKRDPQPQAGSFLETYLEMTQGPAFFQMGVPAIDTFPATLFSRIHAKSARQSAGRAPLYPDPRGEFELRREIDLRLADPPSSRAGVSAMAAIDMSCFWPVEFSCRRPARHGKGALQTMSIPGEGASAPAPVRARLDRLKGQPQEG
ncbi:GntR family transcriptional regulator [Rhizobium leguminosarum]|nr:GntR family transcriptional regulator [Rhizobium leguminosarum]